jgi:hypothetical protein
MGRPSSLNLSGSHTKMFPEQVLQLRSAKLCIDKVAGSARTLALGDCEAPDTPLKFSFDPESGRVVEEQSGMCLDITYCGSQVCAEATVGLYTCTYSIQSVQ